MKPGNVHFEICSQEIKKKSYGKKILIFYCTFTRLPETIAAICHYNKRNP